MSEELENDLKNRISQVFDNYEDSGSDEGWMLLREKFPAATKHRGVARLWWASAAAVLLLFLGIGLWVNFKGDDGQVQIAQAPVKQPKIQQQQPASDPVIVDKPLVEPVSEPTAPVSNNYVATQFTPTVPSFSKQPIAPKVNDVTTGNNLVENKGTNDNVITEQPILQQETPAYAVTTPVNDKPALNTEVQPSITEKAVTEKSVVTQPVIAQQTQQNNIMSMLEKDSRKDAVNNKSGNNKLVNLGVYAATYVNYAKGSDSRVNVGAGISSDFRITKNLKLSTGISIAQNSFNYNSGAVTDVPQAAMKQSVALTTIREDNKMFTGLIAAPTLQNYNANLVGLDIPMNLKYEFSPDKNDTYISAGLSSGTFLNENYTYRYGYNGGVSGSTIQPIDEKISESFTNFYFARTLNVSFGIGYPLGKSNRLVIEPFVKYPLDGMGAQQIKFGSGGINLKLNFQTRKK